jgi:hypothetical protein
MAKAEGVKITFDACTMPDKITLAIHANHAFPADSLDGRPPASQAVWIKRAGFA